jgi:inward rectifier potassium channel
MALHPRHRPPPVVVVRRIGLRASPLQDFYHFLLRRTWPEVLGMAAAAFIGANLLFALVYMLQPGAIAGSSGSFEEAFYFSVQTMATIGYGALSPATRFAHLVVLAEALVGLFSTALITGLAFSKFSRPTARVLFADRFIRTRREGAPHIVFRMANARHNQVIEAQVHVSILVNYLTPEGEPGRRVIDLPLVRDRSPVFLLSFLAMHRIDERSPFRDDAAIQALADGNALIIVLLSGLDENFGQMIYARRAYRMADLVQDVRFVDVVLPHADGSYSVDYTQFNALVPLDAAPPV